MKKLFLILAGMVIVSCTYAQHNISGVVRDSKFGGTLPGAHIILEKTLQSTVSNNDGRFSFKNLKAGTYHISVSYVGYQTWDKKIKLSADVQLDVQMTPKAILEDEVIITSTRAAERTPVTHQNISKKEIEKRNLGQDIPMLLETTPSLVTTSDAGTGIGYTSMRIRGTGLERINVTVNGVPLNDAESHGVFFVDLPDLASSVSNIQIQRGVGTSTNGASAFGASIDIQMHELHDEPYAEISGGAGSFNTLRSSVMAGTGLINNHWTFDARLSKIHSDGFIDRAFSDLKSFELTGGYYGENDIIKVMVMSGKERTYQAWYGVPKDSLNTNRTYNPYTYDNEVDDYQQDHYQIHYSHRFTRNLRMNTALHMTNGEGFYENYKEDRSYSAYTLDNPVIGNDTIKSTDLIQKKWLDNTFYGLVYSLHYESQNKITATLGGSANRYDGGHFGEVIWSEMGNIPKGFQWYENTGIKNDISIYSKVNYQINDIFNLYADLQYRHINYSIDGIHDDLRDLSMEENYNFINPKSGVYVDLSGHNTLYATIGVAHREPNRGAFRDADPGDNPREERLTDYELGYEYQSPGFAGKINLYYMDYKDQLIMTGEINNVGSPIMKNIPNSYRTGVEVNLKAKLGESVNWDFNTTLSQNKIKNFTTYVDNYDTWPEQNKKYIGTTDISFSPELIANSVFDWEIIENLRLSLISQYVGRQYIDNTSNMDRSIDPYFINDLQLLYSFSTKLIPEIQLNVKINNLLDEKYETNAWVYRYYSGGKEYTSSGYFPQAGFHFMSGLTVKF
ncbi:MAG: TonB-dependent receptor [Bacteroidales bacterium]|nr:TonB-dependent receptor [Bacteroidales bacterium]